VAVAVALLIKVYPRQSSGLQSTHTHSTCVHVRRVGRLEKHAESERKSEVLYRGVSASTLAQHLLNTCPFPTDIIIVDF